MATYLVFLKGKNFLVDDDGFSKMKQFRSTRLVEAENQDRAAAMARELINSDPRLQNIRNKLSDPPVILLERVVKVPATAYDAQKRAHSFHWESDDQP